LLDLHSLALASLNMEEGFGINWSERLIPHLINLFFHTLGKVIGLLPHIQVFVSL